MKQRLILIALFIPFILNAQTSLKDKLDEYVARITGLSAEAQSEECDFLISTCKEESVRQEVTFHLYNHYLNSSIMGDDAVAVHIADEWILSGKVPAHSDIEKIQIQLFADFNRESLIDNPAPPLKLTDIHGAPIYPLDDDGYKVLYFYDTGCTSCSYESARLNAFADQCPYPVWFYAIYTGDDTAAWLDYTRNKLTSNRFTHLSDPSMESDFQRLYGVLSTPKMFLIDPDGIIAGRGLDTPALKTLLGECFTPLKSYVYGGEDSMDLFDSLFSLYDNPTKEDILTVAGYLEEETLGKRDTLGWKHLSGDFFYYLSSRHGEHFREAAATFIDDKILSGGFFTSADDTLSVITPASLMRELLAKAPLGSKVPAIRLRGTLRQKPGLFKKAESQRELRLDRLHGRPAYIIIHSPSCSSCNELISDAAGLTQQRGVKVFEVDMDQLQQSDPKAARAALDSFDLSVLPYAAAIDRKGVIIRRYIDKF